MNMKVVRIKCLPPLPLSTDHEKNNKVVIVDPVYGRRRFAVIFILPQTTLFFFLCTSFSPLFLFMNKKNLKHVSLVTLVAQNSALILMMRYTRASVPADQLYLASTAVLMSEVIKTLVCVGVVYTLLPVQNQSIPKLMTFLYRELIINWRETIKLALPAILYLIQVKQQTEQTLLFYC